MNILLLLSLMVISVNSLYSEDYVKRMCVECLASKKTYYKLLWGNHTVFYHCLDRPFRSIATTIGSSCTPEACHNIYNSNTTCSDNQIHENSSQPYCFLLFLVIILEIAAVIIGLINIKLKERLSYNPVTGDEDVTGRSEGEDVTGIR